MIPLVDMRPAWRRPAGAQQRRLPLRHKRLAEIIDLAKNLDDPIQHHRLRHSAMAAYLKKPFCHNPLIARKVPGAKSRAGMRLSEVASALCGPDLLLACRLPRRSP